MSSMWQIDWNDQYLNLTANKDARSGVPILGRCWHETANGSGDPHQTLNWNLKPYQVVNGKKYTVLSSFDILVDRLGGAWRYVDWVVFNSWSEGESQATIDGKVYKDYALGLRLLGIELDGANDGKQKATEAQIDTSARIVLLTEETLHIPTDGKHDFTHAGIAPGRKSDPQGYNLLQIMQRVAELKKQGQPAGLTIRHVPRITKAKWTSILEQFRSPVVPIASELYDICYHNSIDPAVALAFFGKESTFGTRGISAEIMNWGNVRTPFKAARAKGQHPRNFTMYGKWQDALQDWCERMNGRYVDAGLDTVEKAVPVYAPKNDGNNVQEYTDFVVDHVKQWQAQDTPSALTFYRVKASAGANVRQGPGTNFPVARTLKQGEVFGSDGITSGEAVAGDTRWPHLGDGTGFVSMTIVEPA